MKTTLITTTIVLLIFLQSCGSSKKTVSSSAAPEEKYYSRRLTPVTDGKMNEWGDTLAYDNSTKCIYAVANDDSALYIAIKASDRMQQMKIVQGGMEIWIDDQAKKKKTTGIKFPLGGGKMEMPSSGSSAGGQNAKEMAKQMRLQMKLKMLSMELTGFKEHLNGLQSVYSNVPVKAVIEWDDKDNMIYELAIPFAALDQQVNADLNNISIGVFIKGLKMEPGPGGGMPAGGPPAGGMRPPGGGMRSGGGGMPNQDELENMSRDNSFWTKYTIAKK
jgi:hypothetical protein